MSHLFFMCNSINRIWNLCDSWFGVLSVHHYMSRKHILGYQLGRTNMNSISVGYIV